MSKIPAIPGAAFPARAGHSLRPAGFTLVEVVITVAILAILAAIAIPLYQNYVTRGHRATATACLTEGAHFMERRHTVNMRYDEDAAGNSTTFPDLECRRGLENQYAFSLESATATTYQIQAVPQGVQATRDADCGTLTLDETGRKRVSGDTPANRCW